MIKGEDVVDDIIKFRGFWKVSIIDKTKWIVAWLFIALLFTTNTIIFILSIPVDLVRIILKQK